MRIETIMIGLILLFTYFAYCKEVKEQPNCYKQGIPKKGDKEKDVYKRLNVCLTAEPRVIRWRRSLIASVIAIALIFGIVHFRIPEMNELLLYLVIIYVVYYSMWDNFSDTVTVEVIKNGQANLRKLRRLR